MRGDRRGGRVSAPDYPIFDGALEVRARGAGRVLSGRFPYNRTATVRGRGRVRKERFAPGSLRWQVVEFQKLQAQAAKAVGKAVDAVLADALEKRNTFLLVGHSYDKNLADMISGTLTVKHTAQAVELEAVLPDPDKMPSWVRDSLLAVEAGQLRGISPGFQVPAKGGERLIPEPGNPGVMIREITDAVAFEYSLVARPAYSGTDVDARAEDQKRHGGAFGRRRLWL